MKTGHSISGHILSTAYRISTMLCADIPLGVNHSPATSHDINKCPFLREPQCSPHKVPRWDSNRRPAGSTAGASLQPYGVVPGLVLLHGAGSELKSYSAAWRHQAQSCLPRQSQHQTGMGWECCAENYFAVTGRRAFLNQLTVGSD